MYRCSRCACAMDYPRDQCPSCGALLSGVECLGCNYVGPKSVFIANGHRCPKCGSVVQIPASGGGVSDKPDKPWRPRMWAVLAAIPIGIALSSIGIVVCMIVAGFSLCYSKRIAVKVIGGLGVAISVLAYALEWRYPLYSFLEWCIRQM